MLPPPSRSRIQGRACAYWVITSSMKAPPWSAIAVATAPTSTGISVAEIWAAS